MRAILRTAVMVALAAAAGCGGPPTLTPVGGIVKIDGKPAEGVRIYFWPQDVSPGKTFASRTAFGMSDKEGKYTMHCTFGEGVEAGRYKVTFSRFVARDGKVNLLPNQKPEGGTWKESMPPDCTDVNKTKHEAVVSDKNREFTFEISSK